MAMAHCVTCGEFGNWTTCPGEADDLAEGRLSRHRVVYDEPPSRRPPVFGGSFHILVFDDIDEEPDDPEAAKVALRPWLDADLESLVDNLTPPARSA